MESALCIIEFDRQGLWCDATFYPIDQGVERRCRLTANATRTVRETGNFEVAEEVVDAWGCDVHAFIVIFGAFCGDEAVRLVVSAT